MNLVWGTYFRTAANDQLGPAPKPMSPAAIDKAVAGKDNVLIRVTCSDPSAADRERMIKAFNANRNTMGQYADSGKGVTIAFKAIVKTYAEAVALLGV